MTQPPNAGRDAGPADASLPPLPEPFAAAPRPLRGAGCSRGALIGCGVLVALFGISMVALTARGSAIVNWFFARVETKVDAHLPRDLPPADRDGLAAAFRHLHEAMDSGRVDTGALAAAEREMIAAAGAEQPLTPDQVRQLTAAMEKAAGSPPPVTPMAPRAAPTPPASV